MEEKYLQIVVGYYHGKAILLDRDHQIYYRECASSEARIGTVIVSDETNPVGLLDEEERRRIEALFPDAGYE